MRRDAHTPEGLAAEFDKARQEWTPAAVKPGSLPGRLHELAAFGVKLPKAIRDRIAKVEALETVLGPQASAEVAAAEEAHKRTPAMKTALDGAADLELKAGDTLDALELEPDPEAHWSEVLETARRKARAIGTASQVARRDLAAEWAGAAERVLGKAWSELVAFEVDPDTDTLATVAGKEGAAEVAAVLIRDLYEVAIGADKADGPYSRTERKRLRAAFEGRPAVMPTMEAVEAELRQDPRNLAAERAREEARLKAEARDKARREEVRLASLERALGTVGAQHIADKHGQPVLDPRTGDVVYPSGSEGASGQGAEEETATAEEVK